MYLALAGRFFIAEPPGKPHLVEEKLLTLCEPWSVYHRGWRSQRQRRRPRRKTRRRGQREWAGVSQAVGASAHTQGGGKGACVGWAPLSSRSLWRGPKGEREEPHSLYLELSDCSAPSLLGVALSASGSFLHQRKHPMLGWFAVCPALFTCFFHLVLSTVPLCRRGNRGSFQGSV